MTWHTHTIIGANAVWITALTGAVDQQAIFLGAAGALAGLLPDIDAVQAKIHYVAGGTLGMFKGAFRHRAFFHSLLVVAIIFLLSLLFLRQYHPLLPLVLTLGYTSHLLIDGFNPPGARYLFPLKRRFRLLPNRLTVKVGGLVDQLLFVAGTITFLLFLVSQYFPTVGKVPLTFGL